MTAAIKQLALTRHQEFEIVILIMRAPGCLEVPESRQGRPGRLLDGIKQPLVKGGCAGLVVSGGGCVSPPLHLPMPSCPALASTGQLLSCMHNGTWFTWSAQQNTPRRLVTSFPPLAMPRHAMP